MQTLEFKPGDERLGRYAEDGSIAEWPKRDVFGALYERINATVLSLDGKHFVVLPARADVSVYTFKVGAAPARKTE